MCDAHRQDKYAGMGLSDIVIEMARIDADIKALGEKKTDMQHEYDAIRKFALPSAMDDAGISNMNVTGVGRVSLRSDVYASIPATNKEAAFDWLRGTSHGGVIKESVHAGTLKALMKTLIKEGGELPPDEIIRVQPYTMAVLTRTKSDA